MLCYNNNRRNTHTIYMPMNSLTSPSPSTTLTTTSTSVPVFEAHYEFEVALRCYGNETIIQELDSFPSSNAHANATRRLMLETLADMTRDMVVQKLQTSISKYSRDEWDVLKQQEQPCNPQCPLVLALQAYPMNIQSLYDSFLNDVRSWLSRWGRPHEDNIDQFEQMIRNHKQRRMEQQKQHNQENVCPTTSTESIKDDIMLRQHNNDNNNGIRPTMMTDEETQTQKKEQRTNNDQTTATTREVLEEDNSDEHNSKNKSQYNHGISSSSSSSLPLKRIFIQDLQLFDTCQDCVLEGTLVTVPFTPIVGCTTLLQDQRGDIVLLALYNFLPFDTSEDDADTLAQQKIPKGSKVQIKNPFYKIFRDGSRGIRIDNPQDISIGEDPLYGSASLPTNNNNNNKDDDDVDDLPKDASSTKAAAIAAATTNYFAITKCKTDGNALFCKQLYHASSESYLTGLRKDDMTATLLSNRAQCFLNLEDWSNALGDAAASLVLRPHCIRTLSSYRVALTMIETMFMQQQQPSHNGTTADATAATIASPLQTVIQDIVVNSKYANTHSKKSSMFNYKSGGSSNGTTAGTTTRTTTSSSSSTSSSGPSAITSLSKEQQKGIDTIEKLNVRANIAFHKNDYHGAKKFYSQALMMGGTVTRATLCNWSLCSLMMGSIHDALAASVASLRLSMMDDGTTATTTMTTTSLHHLVKALLLLGEPSSAIHILREFPCKFNSALLHASKRLETLLQYENTNTAKKDNNYENSMQCARNVLDFPPSLLPNWSSGKVHARIVETPKEERRGTLQGARGFKQQQRVKALCDIGENEVILIERSLIWCKTSTNKNKNNNNAYPHENDTHENIEDTSNNICSQNRACLQATIINRSERDGLISSIIDKLDDDGADLASDIAGDRSTAKVVPISLQRLLATDCDCVPLLLPSHHEYMTKNKQRVHLTSKRVDGIVAAHAITNSTHGTKGGEAKEDENNSSTPSAATAIPATPGRIGLFPALSMFRRTSSPPSDFKKKGQNVQHNCECHHRQQGSNSLYIVVTNRKIKKDEELIIVQS